MTNFDIKGYTNAWNTHAPDRIAAFYADDAEVIALPNPQPYTSKSGVKQNIDEVLRGLPDVNGDLQWSIQQGDKVSALFRCTARHTGPLTLSPEQTIPPTGKKVDFHLAVFMELDRNGKIKRETQVADSATLLMQVGVLGEDLSRTQRSATVR